MTSRRWIVAAAVLMAAPVLAGCSAGSDANTNQPYAPNEAAVLIDQGEYGQRGIDIPQAFILGPDAGAQIAYRGSVPIYLNILNTRLQPDTLKSVSSGGFGTVKYTAIPLPSNQLVNTGKPTPLLMLEGIPKGLRGGESVRLDLEFANAGTVSLSVPVVTRSREFKDYPAAPNATGAPTPSATASTSESEH